MMKENLVKIYQESFRENRELPALTDYFKKESFSYFEMAKEVAKIHLLYEECKVKRGDKIAIIGRSNPRWCIAYIATITYGAVIVPILPDFNANDVHHIINHSDSELLFVGDAFWDIIEVEQVENIRAAFSLTDFSCLFERKGSLVTEYVKNLTKHFRKRYPQGFTSGDIVYPEIGNNELTLLNYTSGTTGFSKGVMLSVNNLTGNVVFARDKNIHNRGTRVLSFLPLAHTYGCTLDMLLPLAVGAHITLLGKMPAPKLLLEAMAEVRPYTICTVPLIVEKIYKKQIQPLLSKGVMRLALKLPLLDSRIHQGIGRKLVEAFGGARQVIVGGAQLNGEVEEFLLKAKFPLGMGYGMTECAPLISYIDYTTFKPTSCGMVLHGVMEAMIDSSDPGRIPGEILVRGQNVMLGYFKNQEATDAVLEKDGWLHTGDMGTMDPDGTLYIWGRCKSMILGANGQNIYPEAIEAKLNNLYCVMESLVLEREGKLVALVYPDYEQADADQLSHKSLPDIMAQNLAELNTLVAPYEKVSSIVLYPNEFEKTPKRSIKRYLYTV